ncbi:MAG TPA: hypothetical protein VF945_12125 [Polyangia bacterium]
MTTATASSTTLPRRMKSLNPLSMTPLHVGADRKCNEGATAARERRAARRLHGVAAMSQRKDVLLVNRDGLVCEALATALRERHDVRVSRGFRDAVGKIVWRPPDVIVCDVDLSPDRGDLLLAMVARELPRVRRVLYTNLLGAARAFAGVAHVTLPRRATLAELLEAIGGE